ncbi:MAG: rhodanese-like domain-containing protein [Candidatus Aminicenantes bacterium]|nr:rhodanese-like domain-containing protein [Candidatus Aminicenantes bacterium]
MKYRTLFQVAVIIIASAALAAAYNALSPDGLPLFNKYDIKSVNSTLAARYETVSPIKYIDFDTLPNLLENDMALMIDTRDAAAFSTGHIPGAINLEPANFDDDYNNLSKFLAAGKVLVIYGRDAHDSNCGVLAAKLKGRNRAGIFIYKGGMADWLKQGNKIEYYGNNRDAGK